jgi:hypothetical protein
VSDAGSFRKCGMRRASCKRIVSLYVLILNGNGDVGVIKYKRYGVKVFLPELSPMRFKENAAGAKLLGAALSSTVCSTSSHITTASSSVQKLQYMQTMIRGRAQWWGLTATLRHSPSPSCLAFPPAAQCRRRFSAPRDTRGRRHRRRTAEDVRFYAARAGCRRATRVGWLARHRASIRVPPVRD